MNFTQEINDLRAEGKTYQEISIKLNLSIGKIQRILKAESNISIKSDKINGQANEIGQENGQENSSQAPQGITKEEIKAILEDFKEDIQGYIEGRIEGIVRNYSEKTLISLVKSEILKGQNQLNERMQGAEEIRY